MGRAIRFDILGVTRERNRTPAMPILEVTPLPIGFLQRVTTNQVTSSNVGETESDEHECIDGLFEGH
jgi:hypothetical protein